ncbi:hypothetical protein CCGE525_17610 [Rhizobium jaguaris]|uniref:Uncharacterized protein n=1 Tax=Rhizobium jaguaris TaxID=1312183 RepID=A0A387FXR4_9HYPH|nr:hypothetical protein CCGE525_17610 [Rhizobium jaguaris]
MGRSGNVRKHDPRIREAILDAIMPQRTNTYGFALADHSPLVYGQQLSWMPDKSKKTKVD